MDTPIWKIETNFNVYEPAEDSFLLLDALESDLKFLHNINPSILLEVGSGSGVIITALSKALGNNCYCIATDINSQATITTQQTTILNNASVDVVLTDLTMGLKLPYLVDVLVFNPPYVVTENDEISGTLQRAWAGGLDGRIVMDRLFSMLPELLSSKGCFYVVVIDENKPNDIISSLSKSKFSGETIAKRRVRGENLSVLKFQRQS
uniref:Methyltransferase HEMK2 n=2 Tax=Clastoptera arizonana TaxID=38151 RepID=A0A1B6CUB7_9HEMI